MDTTRKFGQYHGKQGYKYFVGVTATLKQRGIPQPYVPVDSIEPIVKAEIENYWVINAPRDVYATEAWDDFIADLEEIAPVQFAGE